MVCWRPYLLVMVLGWATVAPGLELRPDDWQDRSVDGQVAFADGVVTLSVPKGSGGTAELVAKAPVNGDFQVTVSYRLEAWVTGPDATLGAHLGLADGDEAKAQVLVGRGWERTLDEYAGMTFRDGQWRSRFATLTDDREGKLQILRRLGQIRVAVQRGHGWQTLAMLDWDPRAPLFLRLGVVTGPTGTAQVPAAAVRFEKLTIEQLPDLPKPGTGAAGGATGDADRDWLVWANDLGWLHVGSRAQFKATTPRRAEILGGQGEEPLVNTELQGGFENRDKVLDWLCERLTRVVVAYDPTGAPHEIVAARLEGKDYRLRLVGGNDPEALTMAENYDFEGEKAVLAAHGLTPRCSYRRLWLVHALGHSTVDGWAVDNRWTTFSSPPQPLEKEPQKASFEVADGLGGTFTYVADQWEGPYRDNYGLAVAMRRLGIVDEVPIFPPASNYQRKLKAADVPEKPRDFGTEVLGVQPFADPPGLRDWVVYVTGGVWLHIGTRTEYDQPVTRAETLLAGDGQDAVPKKLVDLGRRFGSYDSALRALVKQLTDVRSRFSPTSQPREVVVASLAGAEVAVHLARDPEALVAGYGGYNYGAELALLRSVGLGVRKTFGAQRLVHATGHGTMNGPVKDDFWMMVKGEPRGGNSIELPDGMGGTFGYSLDQVEGPFTDSFGLVPALVAHGLKSIGLYGEDRGVGLLDGPPPAPPPLTPPRILAITPDRGEAGHSFYVTVIAEGMRPGYGFAFGPGVLVSDETCLGRNPDGPGERWLATVTLDQGTGFAPVAP
ncbi:MAG: hypothetical protein HZB16_18280 [Armatimonadetes bacterium]|nr:hypothetical protein [Armatimonadota bacterium]